MEHAEAVSHASCPAKVKIVSMQQHALHIYSSAQIQQTAVGHEGCTTVCGVPYECSLGCPAKLVKV